MAVCKFCGCGFNKKYNREVYCDNCKAEATREKNRLRRNKHYYKWKDVFTYTKYKQSLGTGSLSEHRNTDPRVEMSVIQNEKERFNLI